MTTMTESRMASVRAALGTPNFANETSGDFSELAARMPTRYRNTGDMVRIVPGATDLQMPAKAKAGMPVGFHPAPVLRDELDDSDQVHVDAYISPTMRGESVDARTEAQAALMRKLVHDIGELNIEDGMKAMEYTVKMTAEGKWTPGREGNASDWIGRMIRKYRELKADAAVPVTTQDYAGQPSFTNAPAASGGVVPNVQHDELPQRRTKTDKPMPQYYAVVIDGVTKFYRVKHGTKPGWWWIDAQASDEFHPVRNVATKNMILRAIIAAGQEESMRLYGRELGACGRCKRTLTDDTSRANGIGPECMDKL